MSDPSEPPTSVVEPQRADLPPSDLTAQVTELAAVVAELQIDQSARSRRLRPLEIALIVLLGISLLIHALTVSELLRVRGTLRDQIDQLAASVADAKRTPLSYSLPIDQQLPINIDVPIKRSLDVPIKTSVRIQQTLTVPIDTGLGSIELPVPIDTTVPIDITVPIALDQTLNISTTVPIRLDVPVQLDLGSAQLSPYIDRLIQRLQELRDSL